MISAIGYAVSSRRDIAINWRPCHFSFYFKLRMPCLNDFLMKIWKKKVFFRQNSSSNLTIWLANYVWSLKHLTK